MYSGSEVKCEAPWALSTRTEGPRTAAMHWPSYEVSWCRLCPARTCRPWTWSARRAPPRQTRRLSLLLDNAARSASPRASPCPSTVSAEVYKYIEFQYHLNKRFQQQSVMAFLQFKLTILEVPFGRPTATLRQGTVIV